MVQNNRDTQLVQVIIDNTKGYNGFKSEFASELFGAPKKWNAFRIVFHHMAEHLIKDKRHDLEMQIYHVAHDDKAALDRNL